MELGPASYELVLERGALRRAGELWRLDRRVMVVTDAGVPDRYARSLLDQCGAGVLHTVAPGEASKSLESLGTILSHMLREGFTRADCVVAVGGGMVGDLAGFAASCYMRGVDFYNAPTTVLSQADSSLGGKTAVNLDGIKNAVGAFYQPRGVLIDPDTLRTLPDRERAEGLAEVVKTALIGDAALFERFEREGAEIDVEAAIGASLRVKKAVVERDEKERGERRVLNLGHTIGHGIESVTGLRHGECVALGMLAMCSDAVRARLLPVLEALCLPTSAEADREAVYRALLHDKKASGGTLTVVCVDEPGTATLETVAPEALLPRLALVVKQPPQRRNDA